MDHFSGDVETQLIDLTEVAFSMLRGCDAQWLVPSLQRVMHQVERPRANIGGSGPPGRSD